MKTSKRTDFWNGFLVLISVFVVAISLGACGTNPDDLRVGDTAPDFSLTTAEGKVFSLSDTAGKPVLLYFHMAVG